MSYSDRTLCPQCGRHFISRKNRLGVCYACEKELYGGRLGVKYNSRAVVCVETGKIFKSVADAERSIGASPGRITTAIKKGGTAAGYHWKYEEDK